ncbi:hypothetical protein HUW62_28105 [Myxococcus sp. AM011]|uniref:hypothetical protein n=1 Tax=Myxococcus sp. AM011 TaxID=2745200 RepID=UPI001595EFA5|nr:hypothetical protein [Myxococcus sp. AM011]NVJ25095.1 hypothetical protein [Myxococcus sp. AM011]
MFSGNMCAFPSCGHLMMNAEGVFIGEVCHIEAAESGGERHNPAMTPPQRRHVSNLMLMCHAHHKVTDDVATYTVEKLRKMKVDHEGRFSHPERAILESMQDRTKAVRPKGVRNLKRLNMLPGWGISDEDLLETVERLNKYLERLRRVPPNVRHFLGAISMRAHEMRNTGVVWNPKHGELKILTSDLQDAFGLSRDMVFTLAQQLENYGLGGPDKIEDPHSTGIISQPAVSIADDDGWHLWKDIALFCEKDGVAISVFSDELDFSRFDE